MTQFTQTRRVNLDRYWDQARNAAEQCERLTIPTIHKPIDFDELLNSDYFPVDAKIFAALARGRDILSLAKAVDQSTAKDNAILIGPEGGFSADEQQKLSQHQDIQIIHLGPTILRAETAVIAALSILHIHVTT
jgi:16S rRNA (uracil1498-N3)-methyltransferase